jgi:hypothetical protein
MLCMYLLHPLVHHLAATVCAGGNCMTVVIVLSSGDCPRLSISEHYKMKFGRAQLLRCVSEHFKYHGGQ